MTNSHEQQILIRMKRVLWKGRDLLVPTDDDLIAIRDLSDTHFVEALAETVAPDALAKEESRLPD